MTATLYAFLVIGGGALANLFIGAMFVERVVQPNRSLGREGGFAVLVTYFVCLAATFFALIRVEHAQP